MLCYKEGLRSSSSSRITPFGIEPSVRLGGKLGREPVLCPSFCIRYSVEHHVSDALIHRNNQLIKSASLARAGEHSSAAQPCRRAACLPAPSAAAEQEGSARSAACTEVAKPGTLGVSSVCHLPAWPMSLGTAAPPVSCRWDLIQLRCASMKLLEQGLRPVVSKAALGLGRREQGLVQKFCFAPLPQLAVLQDTLLLCHEGVRAGLLEGGPSPQQAQGSVVPVFAQQRSGTPAGHGFHRFAHCLEFPSKSIYG